MNKSPLRMVAAPLPQRRAAPPTVEEVRPRRPDSSNLHPASIRGRETTGDSGDRETVVSADLDGDRLTLEQQVCFTLAVASREVVSLYRPLLEPLGLTHPQYLVMVTLWDTQGPISVKQLSQLLQLDPPSLSPLLKRLQTAGLVERQRDPADERSVRISLTERGWQLRERAASVPTTIIARLGIDLAELESLQDALNDVIERAKVLNDGPVPAAD